MISLVEHRFQLKIENNQITRILDTLSNQVIQSFAAPLTSQSYKLYVITKNKTILYIGTTKGSIKNRLRGGLKANGANGYHGYKWKIHETISLSVWNFETLNKEQIESIEAELAYIVRKKTKRWPEFQNEIHFNNSFIPSGELIAEKIYRQLTMKSV